MNKSDMKQEFDDYGNHSLVNTKTGKRSSQKASYQAFTYLDGFVGCTDYYTGTGEAIMTPEEFCKMVGVH